MRRPLRWSTGILTLVVVLAVAVVAGLGASHGSSAHERGGASGSAAVSLTVDKATGRTISAGFLGLSLEYPAVPDYAGSDPGAVNPVFLQLIRNLSPNQAPNLRIGGDSTDWTWWPVGGVRKPLGVRYSLSRNWVKVTAALARELRARLILGINLELNSATDAAAEAGTLVSGIGRASIDGLEPGNEPELYGSFSFYRLPNGRHVTGRHTGYGFSDYLRDFSRITGSLPKLPVAGPATGGPHWIPELPNFLAAEPRVRVATLHKYPLQTCFITPAQPQYPTIAHLLSPAASQGLADSVAPFAGVAHARHAALRIDEMNSVSCGDAPGVSNAFISSLWVLDAVFQMARVGVDGVNIHTYPGAPYELFSFTRRHGGWRGLVAPEYYGLEMFAQAAPPGSRLLRTSGSLGNVRAWATRAPDGAVHVVLINEYTAQSRTVTVRIPGARGSATLERLRGKGISATTGVTLGGQTYGTATRTGTLAGHSTVTSVGRKNGAYVVKLPRASAAMLTLAAPPPA
jgi:Glycosyl hydrolase family 79 C-terminal beta domain/Glycosyl hydrolase family 30 beta sandwich domain